MKNILFLSLFLLFVCSTKAQKCDCTNTPYRPNPPCFSYCYKLMLFNSSESYLKLTVGLSDSLAFKVKEIINQKSTQIYTLEDLKKHLTNTEYIQLVGKLEDFNKKIEIEISPK